MQVENFRGEIFVTNASGSKYAERMAESKALEGMLMTLQESHRSLESQFLRSLDEIGSLKVRIRALESSSVSFKNIRHRFLSVFKKKKYGEGILTNSDTKWISAGNDDAHDGNAKYDAVLYTSERKDYNVFKTLYGIHPAIANSLGKSAK
jgi:hypothetical protein